MEQQTAIIQNKDTHTYKHSTCLVGPFECLRISLIAVNME